MRPAGGSPVEVMPMRAPFDDVESHLFAPDTTEGFARGVEATHQVRGAAGELLDGVEAAAGDVDADDARAVEIRIVGDAHVRVARGTTDPPARAAAPARR